MKKTLLSIIYFLACIFSIHAQILYGTTSGGGTEGTGTINKFIPATNNLTVAKSFATTEIILGPGSLIQARDGKLYGITGSGGDRALTGSTPDFGDSVGVIFSFDPFASIYTKLNDFDYGDNGGSPSGSLMQAGDGMLYGMTVYGGSQVCYSCIPETPIHAGVIFSFDPRSSKYTKLHDFDVGGGSIPVGSLLQASDGKLYGMTYGGGGNNYSVIFSFDPSSSTYTMLKDGAAYPLGSLMQASDGKLNSMTSAGGSVIVGVIFSFDPSPSTYTEPRDFDGTNGALPKGSLMQASDRPFILSRSAK